MTIVALTPEEAAAMLCPMRVNPNCMGVKCMGWRWSYDDSDGFETHNEEQAHWSHMVAHEPGALGMILQSKNIAQEQAEDFGRRWVSLWQSKVQDFLPPAHEPNDENGAMSGPLDRVETAFESAMEEADAHDLDDLEDPGELDEHDSIRALAAFREALNELAEEINNAVNAAMSPEAIAAYAEQKRPGPEWGLQQSGCSNGILYAVYQRPRQKRGYCGALGR